jgi:hypothetical protein
MKSTPIDNDPIAWDTFGYDVSISNRTVVIGAPNRGSTEKRGRVHVFELLY